MQIRHLCSIDRPPTPPSGIIWLHICLIYFDCPMLLTRVVGYLPTLSCYSQSSCSRRVRLGNWGNLVCTIYPTSTKQYEMPDLRDDGNERSHIIEENIHFKVHCRLVWLLVVRATLFSLPVDSHHHSLKVFGSVSERGLRQLAYYVVEAR